jgi:hypothetical protein
MAIHQCWAATMLITLAPAVLDACSSDLHGAPADAGGFEAAVDDDAGSFDSAGIDAADASDSDLPKEDGGACTPKLLDGWKPIWSPPNAPTLHACTATQIEREWTVCFDPRTSVAAACDAFERDPANGDCLRCLLSYEEESTHGAIILLRNNSWETNTGGCIALVDGDTSEGGCGARDDALRTCVDEACIDECATYDSFSQCATVAAKGVCRPYANGAVCWRRPVYAICTAYSTSREYFLAYGGLFCTEGFPGVAGPDGGPSDPADGDIVDSGSQ